jgi:murein L,D-transpeptidase YafK
MKRFWSVFLLAVLALASVHVSATTDEISLLLSRSTHTLYVKKGTFILKSYKVALGSGGRYGKLREGDGRTPMGKYKIMQVRASNRFHLFMQLNYPSTQDAKRALIEKEITLSEYRSVLDAHIFGRQPPQNLPLGGAIGIHGIGFENQEKLKIHQNIDWTEGCIALRNAEVEELSQYVSVGTEIHIVD